MLTATDVNKQYAVVPKCDGALINNRKPNRSHAIQLKLGNSLFTTGRASDSTNGKIGQCSQMKGCKMIKSGKKLALKIAALATVTMGLSGCVYDMGLGYYDDGYANYDCDPYSPFDSYYDCDYGYGFYNIGYGGGWYERHWYPGYGTYIFDNYGRRFGMSDHHRRYWGGQRHNWYRDNRGRGGGHHRQGYGHSGNGSGSGYSPIAWPESNGGRVRDGDNDRRGRRHRNRHHDGLQRNDAVSPPPVETNGTPPPGRGHRGDGRRHRGQRGNWNAVPQSGAADGAPAAQPMPRPQHRQHRGNGGNGGNGGGRNWQAAQPQSAQSSAPPAPQPRAPRAERPSRPAVQSGERQHVREE